MPSAVAFASSVWRRCLVSVARRRHVKILPPNDPDCPVVQFNAASIEIAGKGTIHVARQGRSCGQTAPASVGPLNYTVIGGSGMYAGASGRLAFRSAVGRMDVTCACGKSTDTWTGTLTVSGIEFDVTAPTLTGAANKTVKAKKGAKSARVTFQIKAQDDRDGTLPVTCARSPEVVSVSARRASRVSRPTAARTLGAQVSPSPSGGWASSAVRLDLALNTPRKRGSSTLSVRRRRTPLFRFSVRSGCRLLTLFDAETSLRIRMSEPNGGSSRLQSPRALLLPCRRSRVRVPPARGIRSKLRTPSRPLS